MANRLTCPSPLVHVQRWAREWAVGEALGVDPALLNDDRIGRVLDAIAPHLDQIAGSVDPSSCDSSAYSTPTPENSADDHPCAENGASRPQAGDPAGYVLAWANRAIVTVASRLSAHNSPRAGQDGVKLR